MNIKYYIICFLILSLKTFAQIEATTIDGKKVILKNDGKWEYLESQKPDAEEIDCKNLILTKFDKVTGQSITSANGKIVISKNAGKKGLGITLLKTGDNTLIFSIQAIGAGRCIDDSDKINVLFRDGSRLELKNNGKYNCEAKFTLYFGGLAKQTDELRKFKTIEIETLRVWTSDGYVEEDFTSSQSKKIMKTIECLMQ